MPQTPSTRWTTINVLSAVRELTKTPEQRKVLIDQSRVLFNLALSEVVALLNQAEDPAYFVTEVITPAADLKFWQLQGGFGGTNIDTIVAATNTITKSPAAVGVVFKVGQILHVTIWTEATDIVNAQFTARVLTVSVDGNSCTYEVIAGADADADAVTRSAGVIAQDGLSASTYDLTTLTKEFDRVVVIQDSSVGQCLKLTPPEFFSIGGSRIGGKSYESDIVWTQIGNIVHFRVGANVSAGVRTIHYQRQPDYPVTFEEGEFIDLADKYAPLLVKKMYTYVVLQTDNNLSVNVQKEANDFAQALALVDAEMGTRAKYGRDIETDKRK